MSALRSCLSAGDVVVIGTGSTTIVIEEPMNHTLRSSGYTASVYDFVEADTTGGTFIVLLPPLATCSPDERVTVKIVNGANPLTVDGSGGDLVDSGGSYTLTVLKESANFVANHDLSDWLVT